MLLFCVLISIKLSTRGLRRERRQKGKPHLPPLRVATEESEGWAAELYSHPLRTIIHQRAGAPGKASGEIHEPLLRALLSSDLTCSRRRFSLRHLLICDKGFVSDLRRFFVADGAAEDAGSALFPAEDPPGMDAVAVVVAVVVPVLPLLLLLLMALLLPLLFPGLLELLLAPLLLPPPSPPPSVFILAQHGSDDNDSHGIAPRLLCGTRRANGRGFN